MAEPGVAIAVVGSANVDLSILTERLPEPGQTVLGGDVDRGSGGKGANQAVAAARLGARVSLVARVGGDGDGAWLRSRLAAEGLDLTHLSSTAAAPTGTAVVLVDGTGENSIVVSPGANRHLTVDDVAAAGPVLRAARVVLTQLETPVEVVGALRSLVPGRLVLNPAPATAGLDLGPVDVLIPNRIELATLAGGEESDDPSILTDQARSLDVPLAVITLGSRGALIVDRRSGGCVVTPVPAVTVDAVDTTAAGDSFCGAVAVALAEGADIGDAVAWAVRVAASTVTRRGAQESLPTRGQVGPWRPAGT